MPVLSPSTNADNFSPQETMNLAISGKYPPMRVEKKDEMNRFHQVSAGIPVSQVADNIATTHTTINRKTPRSATGRLTAAPDLAHVTDTNKHRMK